MEERIAAEKQKARQAILDKKNEIKRAAAEKKRKERDKIAKKRAREREKVAQRKAAERAERLAERENLLAEKLKIRRAAEKKRAQLKAQKERVRARAAAQREQQRLERVREREAALARRAAEAARKKSIREEAARLRAGKKEQAARLRAELARKKEAEKQRAAEEKLRLKELAAQKKAEELEEKKRLKEQAALQKAKQKEEAARKKEAEKAVAQILKLERQRQTEKWGAPVHELVDALVLALRHRADVDLEVTQSDPGKDNDSLIEASMVLRPAALLWLEEKGIFALSWGIKGQVACGHLDVDPQAITEEAFDAQIVTALQAGFLLPGETTSTTEKVLACSASPRTSKAELATILESRGIARKHAELLRKLLGNKAGLLVEASATAEGLRRAEILRKADSKGADRVNTQLVFTLNRGPRLEKIDFDELCVDHQSFLASGGGGEEFEVLVVDGLPEAEYQDPAKVPGQLSLAIENLSGLKLGGRDLAYSNLCGIFAERANWNKVDLRGSCLRYAHLEEAKLAGANLRGSDFSHARLAGADFRKANLTGTNFENADLTGANFAGATTAGTKFGGAIVRGIKY